MATRCYSNHPTGKPPSSSPHSSFHEASIDESLRLCSDRELLLVAASSQAATFLVTKETDSADGSCDPGDCSLREAILAANANAGLDTVVLPAGTFLLSLPGEIEYGSLTGDLDVTDDLDVTGAGDGMTIIDGGAIDRVFENDLVGTGIAVSISDLTITNGRADAPGSPVSQQGGAIHNRGDLTLTDVSVLGNFAELSGAGVRNATEGSSLTLTRVTFAENIADFLGGGLFNGQGTVVGSLVEFLGNEAFEGGGLYSNDGTLTLTDVEWVGNRTVGAGGGALCTGSTPEVERGLFADNESIGMGDDGGGLAVDFACSATLPSTRVVDNRARSGGGLWVRGTLVLEDSLVARNRAGSLGGGIRGGTSGDVFVRWSTLIGNRATRGGAITAQGGLVELSNTTVTLNSASDDAGALFADAFIGGFVVTSSTLVDNFSPAGNDVYLSSNAQHTFEISGSLVEGRCAGPGSLTSLGGNLESPGDTCQLAAGDQANVAGFVLSPLFDHGGPTATRLPLPGSPAIDFAAACPDNYQWRFPRPVDGDGTGGAACDAGSVEVDLDETSPAIFLDGFELGSTVLWANGE